MTLILSLVQILFFFCFKLMINQYRIQKKEQENNIQPKDKLETEHIQ